MRGGAGGDIEITPKQLGVILEGDNPQQSWGQQQEALLVQLLVVLPLRRVHYEGGIGRWHAGLAGSCL